MNVSLLTAMSFALLLAVAALCREVRLRRSLQELLRRSIHPLEDRSACKGSLSGCSAWCWQA